LGKDPCIISFFVHNKGVNMATAASIQAVQEAYIAYYGRPGDPAGIDFWAERLDAAGGNIDAMISAFGTSAEANARYASLSVTDAVNAIYNQVLGRDAEAGATGLDFYVNKVLSGEFSLVTLAQNIWDGATSGVDAQTVANKLAVAESFTQYLRDDAAANAAYSGNNAAGNARNWLAEVGSSESSVTTQTSAISSVVATISSAPANPGSSFTLTSAATDNLSLTSKDDTVTGTKNGHLATGDRISDASEVDNDVLTAVVNTSVSANLPNPTVSNVEQININGDTLSTGINLELTTGAKDVALNTTFSTSTSMARVTNASTLSTDSVTFGAGVKNFSLSTTSSGTRDTLVVNVTAEGVSAAIVGGAGTDLIQINGASGTIVVTGADLDDSGDKLTVSNVDASSITLNGASTLGSLTINASGALTVRVDGSDGLASGVVVTGTGPVTFEMRTAIGILSGAGDKISSDDVTINLLLTGGAFTGLNAGTTTFTAHLSNIAADLINFNPSTGVTGADADNVILIDEESTLRLSKTMGAAVSIGIGSGAAGLVGTRGAHTANSTLTLEVGDDQASNITLHDSVGTLFISAVSGHTTTKPSGITVSNLILGSATSVIQVTGDERVAFSNIVGVEGSAGGSTLIIDSSQLSERLTLNGFGDAASGDAGSSMAVVLTTGAGGSYASGGQGLGELLFTGGAGADTIVGGAAADTMSGGDGNDRLTGLAGDDSLSGGSGNDLLIGGDGNDTLVGGDGNDTMIGGTGINYITGGSGDDLIVSGGTAVLGSTDTLVGGEGADTFRLTVGSAMAATIADFDPSTDLIQMVGTFSATGTLGGEVTSGLFPSAGGANVLNLSDLSVSGTTNGTYKLGASGVILTGVTTKDLSSSVQLGASLSSSNLLNFAVGAGTAVVTSGALHDYLGVTGTNTASSYTTLNLGDGADTVVYTIGVGCATSALKWKDFNAAEDTIVFTGTYDGTVGGAAGALNAGEIAYHSDSGNLGADATSALFGSAFIAIGSGLTSASNLSLSDAIQFGYSGLISSTNTTVSSNAFTFGTAVTVTGGTNGDVVYFGAGSAAAGAVFNAGSEVSGLTSDGSGTGSFDWIGGSAVGDIKYAVSDLPGINTGSRTVETDAAKQAAVTSESYVFTSGSDGAGTSSMSYSGRASLTSHSLDDVATFLDAQFTVADGQRFVTVINDVSGSSAYAYYVDVSGSDISADDLTLIAVFAFGTVTTSQLG
jgi:hypothetical protein